MLIPREAGGKLWVVSSYQPINLRQEALPGIVDVVGNAQARALARLGDRVLGFDRRLLHRFGHPVHYLGDRLRSLGGRLGGACTDVGDEPFRG
ncbi:MAG: hypothetical protein WBR33_12885 [Pseudonocardiaceae bacterium]|jgi:hypothetical protein